MRTVVKAFKNIIKPQNNRFITRTLGKVGVFRGNGISYKGFWLVEIVKEIHEGKNTGAFVLNPIKKLESDEIRRVTPDDCEVKIINGVYYLTPISEGHCILDLTAKKKLLTKNYAVIVESTY